MKLPLPGLALIVAHASCGGESSPRVRGQGALLLSEPPNILGVIDEREVLAAIDEAMPRLSGCYTRRLHEAPALAGAITIRFFVEDSGMVAGATILESELDDSATETCLIARLAGISFPHPRGSGEVAVTTRFQALPGKPADPPAPG